MGLGVFSYTGHWSFLSFGLKKALNDSEASPVEPAVCAADGGDGLVRRRRRLCADQGLHILSLESRGKGQGAGVTEGLRDCEGRKKGEDEKERERERKRRKESQRKPGQRQKQTGKQISR